MKASALATHFSFGGKRSNRYSLARRHGKVGDTFNAQLIPDSTQVMGLVELDLVVDTSGAELFVCGILEVPSSL